MSGAVQSIGQCSLRGEHKPRLTTVYMTRCSFVPSVGNDENISNTWKFLSHSTDSLNKIVKVNESTESLTDEGKRKLRPALVFHRHTAPPRMEALVGSCACLLLIPVKIVSVVSKTPSVL